MVARSLSDRPHELHLAFAALLTLLDLVASTHVSLPKCVSGSFCSPFDDQLACLRYSTCQKVLIEEVGRTDEWKEELKDLGTRSNLDLILPLIRYV
ncbi:hypothetical protein B0T10DRAFT_490334 [Thelonectria olida]|uniref:Uncharacterized protein n=1 Tax=Thelonectria olida TaxID=1576542 RepID=A0A9P8W1M2_9HYPO|nr:hypothetical protein B0T10DRAFT_490334 [Thelonectria olida]